LGQAYGYKQTPSYQPKFQTSFPASKHQNQKERKKMSKALSFNPLIPLKMHVIHPQFPAKKTTTKPFSISARLQNQQQQQLNLSVLRFTLGISLCIYFLIYD
jgi:hypothetical protein